MRAGAVVLVVFGGNLLAKPATVAFADVTPARMADANALAATTRQLGAALGVALAGVMLHFGQVLDPAVDPSSAATPYLLAFALVAVPAVLACADVLARLPAGAGDNLRRPAGARDYPRPPPGAGDNLRPVQS